MPFLCGQASAPRASFSGLSVGPEDDCDQGWAIRMLRCWCGLTALESTVIAVDRRADGGRAPHQPTTPQTRKPEDSGAAHTQQTEPPSTFLLKFISKLSVVKVRAISWKQMESPPASALHARYFSFCSALIGAQTCMTRGHEANRLSALNKNLFFCSIS